MKLLTDIQIELIRQDAVAQYKRLQNENILKIEQDIVSRQDTVVGFNFADPNINVFSIERIHHGTPDERTVLGYYLSKELRGENNKVIEMWHLHISRNQHNELVKQWGAYLSKETKPKKSLLKG